MSLSGWIVKVFWRTFHVATSSDQHFFLEEVWNINKLRFHRTSLIRYLSYSFETTLIHCVYSPTNGIKSGNKLTGSRQRFDSTWPVSVLGLLSQDCTRL